MFRQEALDAQHAGGLGEIVLIRPVSFSFLTLLAAAMALLVVGFFLFGSYTKRSTVSGQLVPASGQVKVHAPQAGRHVHAAPADHGRQAPRQAQPAEREVRHAVLAGAEALERRAADHLPPADALRRVRVAGFARAGPSGRLALALGALDDVGDVGGQGDLGGHVARVQHYARARAHGLFRDIRHLGLGPAVHPEQTGMKGPATCVDADAAVQLTGETEGGARGRTRVVRDDRGGAGEGERGDEQRGHRPRRRARARKGSGGPRTTRARQKAETRASETRQGASGV